MCGFSYPTIVYKWSAHEIQISLIKLGSLKLNRKILNYQGMCMRLLINKYSWACQTVENEHLLNGPFPSHVKEAYNRKSVGSNHQIHPYQRMCKGSHKKVIFLVVLSTKALFPPPRSSSVVFLFFTFFFELQKKVIFP